MIDVSIIIPTCNEADQIVDCLDSAWSAGPCEVLVVDGGSQDVTVRLAQSGASHVLTSEPGRGTQQNLGARCARGKVLLFLHADCRLDASVVRQIAVVADRRQPVCGAFRQRIDMKGWKYRCLEHGNAWRASILGMPYGDQAIFVERRLFEEIGGFSDVRLMEDVDLMWRLRRRARPVVLPGPVVVSPRRWRRHGVVRQTLRNWTLMAAWTCGMHPNRLARYYPPCNAATATPGSVRVAAADVVKSKSTE